VIWSTVKARYRAIACSPHFVTLYREWVQFDILHKRGLLLTQNGGEVRLVLYRSTLYWVDVILMGLYIGELYVRGGGGDAILGRNIRGEGGSALYRGVSVFRSNKFQCTRKHFLCFYSSVMHLNLPSVHNSNFTAPYYLMILNNELETLWKVAVVTESEALSTHLPGGMTGKNNNLAQKLIVFQLRFEQGLPTEARTVTSWTKLIPGKFSLFSLTNLRCGLITYHLWEGT
jgi:hypothetical protein